MRGVEVDDPLAHSSIKLGGIFLGQDGVDGPGVLAVLERIEPYAGLAGLGLGPRGLLVFRLLASIHAWLAMVGSRRKVANGRTANRVKVRYL